MYVEVCVLKESERAREAERHTETETATEMYLLYGVATISRLLQIIGFFCKRALQKRPIFCKRDLYS